MFGLTYAIFIAGVVAIAGPILAHLFNRSRFRRVPFTMLAFLQRSEKQTQSRRRIREFLILLMRCAIIVLIVLAFAGPVLKRVIPLERSFDQHVLVLDNSLSMTRTHGSQRAWDQMITAAKDYLHTHDKAENLFSLHTTNAGAIVTMVSADIALAQLEKLKPCPGDSQPQTLMASLQQIHQQMGENDKLYVHIVSDFTPHFQESWLQSLHTTQVDQVSYTLIAPHAETNNLAITDVQALGIKDNKINLATTVMNQGLVAAKGVIQAKAGSAESKQRMLDLAPGQTVIQPLVLDIASLHSQPSIQLDVTLSPDDDLTADNHYPLAVSVLTQSQQNVLLVGAPKTTFLMKTALQALSHQEPGLGVNLTCLPFAQLHGDAVRAADILIVSQLHPALIQHLPALNQCVARGGRLVIFNGQGSDIPTAQTLYQAQLLPALPIKAVHRPTSPEALDCAALPAWSTPQERQLLEILNQYKLENTPLWHYSTCQPSNQGQGLWRIDDHAYLAYWQPHQHGRLILFNTSMDDAFSALTKSPAVPALARWILGTSQQLSTFAFAANAPLNVPKDCFGIIRDPENVGFVNADGQRVVGRVVGSTVLCPGPHQLGWMRSISEPVHYFGIHPVENENRMAPADNARIEAQLQQAFNLSQDTPPPMICSTTTQNLALGLEKWCLWLAIALMLTDAVVTNRMQR